MGVAYIALQTTLTTNIMWEVQSIFGNDGSPTETF
jgi:hypothetical protein